MRVVAWEVGVEFRNKIVSVARQQPGFNMQSTACGLYSKNSRRRNFSLTLQTKDIFYRVDAIAQTQQTVDVAATQ